MIRLASGPIPHSNFYSKRRIVIASFVCSSAIDVVDYCSPIEVNGHLFSFSLGRIRCEVHEHPPQELVS